MLQGSPAAALICLGFMHNIIRRHAACMQLLHRPPRGGLTAVAALMAEAEEAGGDASAGPSSGEGAVGGEGTAATTNGAAAANGTAAPGRRHHTQQQQHQGDDRSQQQADQEQQQEQGQQQVAAVYRGQDPYDPSEPDPGRSRAIESSLWELEALRRHACPAVSALTAILDKDLSDRKKTAEVSTSKGKGVAIDREREERAGLRRACGRAARRQAFWEPHRLLLSLPQAH